MGFDPAILRKQSAEAAKAFAKEEAKREREQREFDAKMDKKLEKAGFDPVKFRKQSEEAAEKPLNIPGVENFGERKPKPVSLPLDNLTINP